MNYTVCNVAIVIWIGVCFNLQSYSYLRKKRNETSLTIKNIALICYFLFWLLKPFYLSASGSVQIGDLFLGVSFILLCFGDRLSFGPKEIDKYLYYFFGGICFVNVLYFIIYLETSFLRSTLYYVFNFMALYLYREFESEHNFYDKFAKIQKLNIIIQFVLLITGVGEWIYGGSRYIGTYNDPNQLGFGVLSAYCLIFCISRKINVKYITVYFAMSVYIIYQSSSTGMLMAIAILFVCEQYFRTSKIKEGFGKTLYVIYLIIITAVFVLLGIELFRVVLGGESEIFFLRRLSDKLNKGDNIIESFIRDRNLGALVENPIYILFGSGEAMMLRFADTHGEIHSTWLGFLFYYGIIPFSFLITWIKQNLKNLDLYTIPVYACLFLEAFTLVNHRQPSFWTLIALAAILKRNNDEKCKEHGVV